MKTLLGIILIFSFTGVFGQNDTVTMSFLGNEYLGTFDGDTFTVIKPILNNEVALPNFRPSQQQNIGYEIIDFEDRLLELLDLYSTECYNDSTELFYYTINGRRYFCNEGDTLWLFSYADDIVTCNGRWHHTHKPTFTGFIEWLKERNK